MWKPILPILWLFVLVNADIFHQFELDLRASELPGGIISITNNNLLIISRPNRDHFTLLVLTSTDDKHKCDVCHVLKRLLVRVASAWYKNYPGSQYLYFAEVDVVDRSNVEMFNYLKLDLVPQIWLIPPSHIAELHNNTRAKKFNDEKEEYFDNYDILLEPHAQFEVPDSSFDDQVFRFADWLAIGTQKRVIVKEENAVAKFIATFGATFGAILLLKKKGPKFITGTVTKGKIYQVMTFFALLAILGGYSFSSIQRVPFIAQNDKGEPIYISGGIHYQFGVEILLVSANYLLLGIAFVTLVYLGKYRVTDKSAIKSTSIQAVLQIVALGVVYLLFSILTSMFLRKDSGYPYLLTKLF